MIDLGLVTSTGFTTAVDIVGMFQWTGRVCYFTVPEGSSNPSQVCYIDQDLNAIYEACEPLTIGLDGLPYCPTEGYSLITAYCQT